jgi:G:T-mismatch repair DNA endonuclease (very short patch repair protein)
LNGRVVSKCKECGHIYTSSKWEDTGYCSSECKNKIYTRKQSVFEKKIFEFISTAISEYTVVSNPIITISDRKIVPDILIGNKLIIECYGDYWHCNPEFYNRDYFHKQIRKFSYEIWESDSYRTKILNDAGYDVIVIWENDFNVKKISLDTIKNNIYEIYKNRKN